MIQGIMMNIIDAEKIRIVENICIIVGIVTSILNIMIVTMEIQLIIQDIQVVRVIVIVIVIVGIVVIVVIVTEGEIETEIDMVVVKKTIQNIQQLKIEIHTVV